MWQGGQGIGLGKVVETKPACLTPLASNLMAWIPWSHQDFSHPQPLPWEGRGMEFLLVPPCHSFYFLPSMTLASLFVWTLHTLQSRLSMNCWGHCHTGWGTRSCGSWQALTRFHHCVSLSYTHQYSRLNVNCSLSVRHYERIRRPVNIAFTLGVWATSATSAVYYQDLLHVAELQEKMTEYRRTTRVYWSFSSLSIIPPDTREPNKNSPAAHMQQVDENQEFRVLLFEWQKLRLRNDWLCLKLRAIKHYTQTLASQAERWCDWVSFP